MKTSSITGSLRSNGPLLIVWGREDKLIPLPFGKRFSKEIIGSRLIILEQCGHMPQVECDPEFNASLLKFLGGD
ncbi:MAG: alpha/beta hydrolase [Acidobacteriota bacterium]|nr:alpha/beta hydrolase [Acidobacteriota bacterium]